MFRSARYVVDRSPVGDHMIRIFQPFSPPIYPPPFCSPFCSPFCPPFRPLLYPPPFPAPLYALMVILTHDPSI